MFYLIDLCICHYGLYSCHKFVIIFKNRYWAIYLQSFKRLFGSYLNSIFKFVHFYADTCMLLIGVKVQRLRELAWTDLTEKSFPRMLSGLIVLPLVSSFLRNKQWMYLFKDIIAATSISIILVNKYSKKKVTFFMFNSILTHHLPITVWLVYRNDRLFNYRNTVMITGYEITANATIS